MSLFGSAVRRVILASTFALSLLGACQGQGEAPQCDTSAAVASPATSKARRPGPDADWCRACVMSPKGFASCQRVYAETAQEARQVVRQRSIDKACADAGFASGQCPNAAIIAVGCKGDPTPAGTKDAGAALQQLFLGAKGGARSTDSAAPSASDKPDRPRSTDPPVL